jgi:hypothetical protein
MLRSDGTEKGQREQSTGYDLDKFLHEKGDPNQYDDATGDQHRRREPEKAKEEHETIPGVEKDMKGKDWNCPSCNNLNWSWRANCNSCGTMKPVTLLVSLHLIVALLCDNILVRLYLTVGWTQRWYWWWLQRATNSCFNNNSGDRRRRV